MLTFFNTLNENLPLAQQASFIIRIAVAAFCGALVGVERSKRLKEAGVRTHCLVACASAAFMILSKYAFADLETADGFFTGSRGADPARIAAGVVSGVSFLGAGIIFKNRYSSVTGLTTAAGIWATAAIGMSIGAGLYLIGVATTMFIILLQIVMHRHQIGNDLYSTFSLDITYENTPETREDLERRLQEMNVQVMQNRITKHPDGTVTHAMVLRCPSTPAFNKLDRFAETHPEIRAISYSSIG